MPDKDVRTIRDLIYYQYSKLIARSAFKIPDGETAKRKHYGFIKNTFKDMKEGKKRWSQITSEDKQLESEDNRCVYCGAESEHLQREHIVPQAIAINLECADCPRIREIHNMVLACPKCSMEKRDFGLYHFFAAKYPDDRMFYDRIPPRAEKKYLKTIYYCHKCADTLDFGDIDGDGVVTVKDIDAVIRA